MFLIIICIYLNVKELCEARCVCNLCSFIISRLRDRVTVKTGARHIVRESTDGTFEMKIKSAVRSDSGIYTCRIINEYGTKQCEGRLEVKGTRVSRLQLCWNQNRKCTFLLFQLCGFPAIWRNHWPNLLQHFNNN